MFFFSWPTPALCFEHGARGRKSSSIVHCTRPTYTIISNHNDIIDAITLSCIQQQKHTRNKKQGAETEQQTITVTRASIFVVKRQRAQPRRRPAKTARHTAPQGASHTARLARLVASLPRAKEERNKKHITKPPLSFPPREPDKMVVGEFNASNIAMEEDARDEEKQRKSTLDLPKFRADVAAALAVAKASPAQLQAGVDALLGLEKQARLAEDITGSKLACGAVLDACHAAGQWRLLEENATLLAKRRGQLKQATQHVVRLALAFADKGAPDKGTRVALLKALQAVTEGKIFVEIERARITRRLARIKEADGDVAGAADELQEVPVVRRLFFFSLPRGQSVARERVPLSCFLTPPKNAPPFLTLKNTQTQETFGAMAKTEKVAYILDQVRLCLAKGDHARAQILARKVSPRAFVPKRSEEKGQIGIEGTAIEEAEEVRPRRCSVCLLGGGGGGLF